MRSLSILFLALSITLLTKGQLTNKATHSDTMQSKIVIIGDAGVLINGRQPVIEAVRKSIRLDEKTVVIFLGDNIYDNGLPDESSPEYPALKAVLDSQIVLAKGSKARFYFTPGNHDWDYGGPAGWENISRQQMYVDRAGGSNVEFVPKQGCPGPVEIPVSNDVVIVVVDTQWWLHLNDKPGIESDCDVKTKSELLSQLEDMLSRNSRKLVVLATHHAFKTYGPHGRYYPLKTHIFPFTELYPNLYVPLPLIGSVYPITRGIFGTIQDLPHPIYKNMASEIEKVAKGHPNVIFVAGHEHSLQLIKDSSYNYIVSGSGVKITRVSKGKNSLYAASERGFTTLDISENKNVKVNFFEVTDSARIGYSAHLLNFSSIAPDQITKDSATVVFDYSKSVTVSANTKYDSASGFKRFFLGDNYRKEWAVPVEVKQFDIRTEKGGLTIRSLQGGRLSRTLRLSDKSGREWLLRSLKKAPERILPGMLSSFTDEKIAGDQISATHPYSSLVVPELSKTIGITEAKPQLFFVPDDPAFGFYRQMFANTLCYLQEQIPGPDKSALLSTAGVIDKITEDSRNKVDQYGVLKARILDILVGDWSRHFAQWSFTAKDSAGIKIYKPVPKDRDMAFYYSDGFTIRTLSKNYVPFLTGFKNSFRNINRVEYTAKDFDRIFLTQLDHEDWRAAVAEVTGRLTDSVINLSARQMPAPVYAISGSTVESKLKSRKNSLEQAVLKYYKFLSKEVDVLGTNKDDRFIITGNRDSLVVQAFDKTATEPYYKRTFVRSTTHEIRLYGLNGNDQFKIESEVTSPIVIRLIGGKGEDTFDVRGNVKNYLYDQTSEKNVVLSRNRSTDKFSPDADVNHYDIADFRYNENKYPRVIGGFNSEDRLLLGFGYERIRHRFRKDPFKSRQKFSALFAITKGAYRLNYIGEFNQVVNVYDLVASADLADHVLNNFFGLGNETKINKEASFYNVRYNYLSGDLMLRKRMGEVLQFSAGPQFYRYWITPKDNTGKVLNNPALIGLDSAAVYSTKTYIGGKLNILINNLGDDLMPTRGIYWNTTLSHFAALSNTGSPVVKLTSDMIVHGALTDPAKVVGVFRIGGGRIFNRNFEYFQALDLGQNNVLRGFRKNRFTGSSTLYTSLELRLRVAKMNSYVVPGDIGVLAFNELGKVWMRGQKSGKWHHSLGGGLYYTAFNAIVVSATGAYSKENWLFNVSIAPKMNLIF